MPSAVAIDADRPAAGSAGFAAWRREALFLVKVARPGFWTTSLWFYLLPLGQRHVFGQWTFWLGCVYVMFPLGLLIYGWNDLVDAETDRLNPRKGTFLFGARPDDAQLAALPWRIALVEFPFAVAFVCLFGFKAVVWLAALVFATMIYNWPPPGLKGRPPFELLNQTGYLLVFVLSSWLNGAPQLPWQTFLFGTLFAMHAHLFGQIMDVEPDALSGRRTTAVLIGVVPAKLLVSAFLTAESVLVAACFHDAWISAFLGASAGWFTLDATLLWGSKHYRPAEMRFFSARLERCRRRQHGLGVDHGDPDPGCVTAGINRAETGRCPHGRCFRLLRGAFSPRLLSVIPTLITVLVLAVLPISALPRPAPAADGATATSAPSWLGRVNAGPAGSFPSPRSFTADYVVTWSDVEAARVEVKCASPEGGTEIHTDIKAATNGAARLLYKLDANGKCVADRRTLRPVRFEQRQDASGRHYYVRVEFSPSDVVRSNADPSSPPADPAKAKPRHFPYPGMFDMHTALLYLRSLPLAVGEEKTFPVFASSTPYLVTIKVLGRERVKVRAGDFPAILCSLSLQKINKFGELEVHKNFKSARAWLSDDSNRTLLKIATEVFVGSVNLELDKITY